jgi:hypothetical protein
MTVIATGPRHGYGWSGTVLATVVAAPEVARSVVDALRAGISRPLGLTVLLTFLDTAQQPHPQGEHARRHDDAASDGQHVTH